MQRCKATSSSTPPPERPAASTAACAARIAFKAAGSRRNAAKPAASASKPRLTSAICTTALTECASVAPKFSGARPGANTSTP